MTDIPSNASNIRPGMQAEDTDWPKTPGFHFGSKRDLFGALDLWRIKGYSPMEKIRLFVRYDTRLNRKQFYAACLSCADPGVLLVNVDNAFGNRAMALYHVGELLDHIHGEFTQ